MAGSGKIEAWGLAPRIEELISSGVKTSVEISAVLKSDGFDVSQPTISRYLKKVRETRCEETRKIVQDHVQKTVPTDLKALEDMEAQCLTWAEEDLNAFAHRLAAKHIDEHIETWVSRIYEAHNSTDEDARKAVVKDIIRQSLSWVADDKSLQKSRINAMRMAANIIDLKLRYSGIIEGSNEGGIFFVNPESGDRLKRDEKTDRLMVIKGGAD